MTTYGLGSCIALAIHDPVASVGGLLHFMLPESSLNPRKAGENPYLFADTGIPLLFQAAYAIRRRETASRRVGSPEAAQIDG